MTLVRETRFRIPADRAGGALLDFLNARFPYHSAGEWEERIRGGRVRVNGAPAQAAQTLADGDLLEYDSSDIPEPPADMNVSVVFDDADLLVVNKSGDLTCHPGGRYFHHTLWAIAKTRFGIAEPYLVNRLDRETSGLVIIARHERAAKVCRKQFADRKTEKRYRVLVEGEFPATVTARGRIEPAEGAAVRNMQRFVAAPDGAAAAPDGTEWSETRFVRMARHGPVSEIEAQPRTGRLHQIRATLLALGNPVAGDKLYGVDPGIFVRFCQGAMTDADRARLRMPRQALHAARLRLRHPATGRVLDLEAPMPEDMTELIRQLDAAGGAAP